MVSPAPVVPSTVPFGAAQRYTPESQASRAPSAPRDTSTFRAPCRRRPSARSASAASVRMGPPVGRLQLAQVGFYEHGAFRQRMDQLCTRCVHDRLRALRGGHAV